MKHCWVWLLSWDGVERLCSRSDSNPRIERWCKPLSPFFPSKLPGCWLTLDVVLELSLLKKLLIYCWNGPLIFVFVFLHIYRSNPYQITMNVTNPLTESGPSFTKESLVKFESLDDEKTGPPEGPIGQVMSTSLWWLSEPPQGNLRSHSFVYSVLLCIFIF